MTTLFIDQFTGTNGATVDSSKWAIERATTGASATIQSNRGRWDAGSLTNYTGAISVIYSGADQTDAEWLTATFKFNGSQDGQIEAWARCDDATNPARGYYLLLQRSGSIALYRANAFTYTSIASSSFSFTTGTDYKFRFRVVGTTVQAKVWLASDAEPSSWTMSVTDTVVTAAGQAVINVQGGGDPGMSVDFDDVTLTDGASSLTRVNSSAAFTWGVLQRVSSSAATQWDVYQRVTGTKQLQWDVQSGVLTRVNSTASYTWDVRQRVMGDTDIAWTVQATGDIVPGAYVKRNGSLTPITL